MKYKFIKSIAIFFAACLIAGSNLYPQSATGKEMTYYYFFSQEAYNKNQLCVFIEYGGKLMRVNEVSISPSPPSYHPDFVCIGAGDEGKLEVNWFSQPIYHLKIFQPVREK